MDDDRDYSDDLRDDYLLDQYGPLYAEGHAAEIALDYQTSGLYNATLGAHGVIYPLALVQVQRAKAKLADGEWEEAIFHAGRALDGYASAVFIAPIRELIVGPFRDAFSHAKVKTDTILGEMTGLESGLKFVRLVIAATRAKDETRELTKALRTFIDRDAPGDWFTRNLTVHSLRELAEDEAKTFVANAEAFLERLADPLEAVTQAGAAAERGAEERRASRKSVGDF